MKLLYAWRNALTLFYPSQFKLLSLVTVKNCIATSRCTIQYFWWLFLLVIGAFQLFWHNDISNIHYTNNFTLHTTADTIAHFGNYIYPYLVEYSFGYIFWYLFVYYVYCAARASTQRKDWHYFSTYTKKIPFAFGLSMYTSTITMLVPIIVVTILYSLSFYFSFDITYFLSLWWVHQLFTFLSTVYWMLTNLLSKLALLFLLDTHCSIRSIYVSFYRAVRMIYYNIPLFLPLSFFFILCGKGSKYIADTINIQGSFLLVLFVFMCIAIATIICVCILNTLYTKRLYEQYDVYFPKHIKEIHHENN